MNSKIINIVLAVIVVILLALLAQRVSFEARAGSGGCCGKDGTCGLATKGLLQGRLK